MTDMMRQWITSITCAAILTAVLQAFLPQNGLGKAGRLVGSLVLMIATIQPLVSLDYDALAQSWAEIGQTEAGDTASLEQSNRGVLKRIIEQQTAAYILDKAEELGVDCQVEVTYAWDENGTAYPSQASITSSAAQAELEQLADWMETELGIPRSCQMYERTAE
jgi:stage III sporulation protein AF